MWTMLAGILPLPPDQRTVMRKIRRWRVTDTAEQSVVPGPAPRKPSPFGVSTGTDTFGSSQMGAVAGQMISPVPHTSKVSPTDRFTGYGSSAETPLSAGAFAAIMHKANTSNTKGRFRSLITRLPRHVFPHYDVYIPNPDPLRRRKKMRERPFEAPSGYNLVK
jgi:hypothetical protein